MISMVNSGYPWGRLRRFVAALFGVVLGMTILAMQSPRAYADPNDPISFPDSNLEAAIKEALGIDENDPITKGDVEDFTSLNVSHKGITDLTGIEHLTDLTFLQLSSNDIDDISPVSDLDNLKHLGLAENDVSDLTPLENLSSLTIINVSGNDVSDISPLGDLPGLIQVTLTNNQVEDISPLAALDAPEQLELSGNQISDISPLAELTSVETLLLNGNPIGSLVDVEALENLTSLDIGATEVSTLSSLTHLNNITDLVINSIDTDDLSVLADLPQLEELSARTNRISDLAPLSGLSHLKSLDLWNNSIADLSPIESVIANLENFDARGQVLHPGSIEVDTPVANPVIDAEGNPVELTFNDPDLSYNPVDNTYSSSTLGIVELQWAWTSGVGGEEDFSGRIEQEVLHVVALPKPEVTHPECVEGQVVPPEVTMPDGIEGIADYQVRINDEPANDLDGVVAGDEVEIIAVADPSSGVTIDPDPEWQDLGNGEYLFTVTIEESPQCPPDPDTGEPGESDEDGDPLTGGDLDQGGEQPGGVDSSTAPTTSTTPTTTLPATGVSDHTVLGSLAVVLLLTGAFTVVGAQRRRG